jgi:hypothetical protein
MKAKYKKELSKVSLTIETNQFYKEDYQMKMLRENEIEGLLKVECHHIDNESVFIYDVSNMLPLRKKFELIELKYGEIINVVEAVMDIAAELQQYFLAPDCLVLDPSLIYWSENRWSFLYLPVKKSDLAKAFHELTEYFVKTLDYKEVEGIKIASYLHKETLQENFNLKDILSRYEEQYEENPIVEVEGLPKETRGITIEDYHTNQLLMEGKVRSEIKEAEEIYEIENKGNKKSVSRPIGREKRAGKPRVHKKRWGDWGDMIIE